MRTLLLVLVPIAMACTRSPETLGPSPENKPQPSAIPAPPPQKPNLVFSEVRCTYGGTAPAFFVWAEATTDRPVTKLVAKRFEIMSKTWVSGAASTIAVRRRVGKNGEGNVTPLTSIEPGATLHFEVFGPLALAPFGPDAGYPTDDRAFRVEVSAAEGEWTISGTCNVGPAG